MKEIKLIDGGTVYINPAYIMSIEKFIVKDEQENEKTLYRIIMQNGYEYITEQNPQI